MNKPRPRPGEHTNIPFASLRCSHIAMLAIMLLHTADILHAKVSLLRPDINIFTLVKVGTWRVQSVSCLLQGATVDPANISVVYALYGLQRLQDGGGHPVVRRKAPSAGAYLAAVEPHSESSMPTVECQIVRINTCRRDGTCCARSPGPLWM